jgi:hypothetical protein
MKRPNLKFTVRRMMLAVAGIAVLCGVVVCSGRTLENRLVVENQSGQPLVWLTIGLHRAGPIVTFKDLPDGGTESTSIKIRGDDEFMLNGILADGTKVGGSFGYVTSGEYGESPRFIVRKGGKIDFTQ